MARQAIAVIALAPGEIGYYDDYSRIYLSNESPKAVIYAGTNLFQIRKSIANPANSPISFPIYNHASLFYIIACPCKNKII